MTRDVLNEQVKVYLMKRAVEVLEWYTTGDVEDCTETRTNINRDLMSVLKETERKFRLKPFKRVLRGTYSGPWWHRQHTLGGQGPIMSVCITTLIKHFKIVHCDGSALLREPGHGDGPLWGDEGAIVFESEKDAYNLLDRYFTRRIARVVRTS